MKKIYIVAVILISLLGGTMKAQSPQLWGLTYDCGVNNCGSIVKINEAGTGIPATIYSFDTLTGIGPYGSLLMGTDGKLYGLCEYGGTDTAHHSGHNQPQGSGVIFSYDPVYNVYTDLYNFDFVHGAYPQGSLIQLSNGKLYGTANWGGLDSSGVIFSFNPVTNIYTDLHDFDNNLGSNPIGSLIQASNGKLYGTTIQGGDTSYYFDGMGTIFSFDTSTNICAELYSFELLSGFSPEGNLIQATNGKLYGVTTYGGDTVGFTQGRGVIFSFDPTTNLYSNLYYDSTIDRSFLPLIQATNGLLYGMNQGGRIFSFDISNDSLSILHNFSNGSGILVQGSNGYLYGASTSSIFSIDTTNNDSTILYIFGCIDYGAFIELPASTGIQETQKQNNEVTVYPNPAADQLTIISATNMKMNLKVEDITGRQVIQTIEFIDEALTETIDISSLRNGLYFVVVTDEKNNYIQRTKFVKLK